MPRRWFQLHLSTCVVLMLVAGGLLFANLRPNDSRFFYGYPKPALSLYSVDGEVAEDYPDSHRNWTSSGEVDGYADGHIPSTYWVQGLNVSVIPAPFIVDLLAALLVLVVTAVGLEWRIRRSSA